MDASTGVGTVLPAGFENLGSLRPGVGASDRTARYAKRLSTDIGSLRNFHAAILPRMDRSCGTWNISRPTTSPHRQADAPSLSACAELLRGFQPDRAEMEGPDLDNAFPASRIVYQAPSSTEN